MGGRAFGKSAQSVQHDALNSMWRLHLEVL